jgi:DNA polymerase III subunit gamma/tau
MPGYGKDPFMTRALYRTWRPALWEEIIGQEHVIQTLRNAVRTNRIGHAYLFAGPRGTGKTTTARLLAKAVNCLDADPGNHPCNQCEFCLAVNESRFLDLIEIDAASNTSVEDVRALRDKINFSPNQGKYKVYIIDEVHMLSTAAFNALLKTLEEPPAHAIFILATTEVHKIPPTVLSRCQRHEFRRISNKQISDHLAVMAQKEGIQVEEKALNLIARQSTGSLRDAISLLDQLSSLGGTLTLSTTQNVLGTATNQVVIDLVDAILADDAKKGISSIHLALDAGSDPRQLARQVVDYLRTLLLLQMNSTQFSDLNQDLYQLSSKQARSFSREHLIQTIKFFNTAATEPKSGWHPALLLELAMADALKPSMAAQPKESRKPAEGPMINNPAMIKENKPENIEIPVTQTAQVEKPNLQPKTDLKLSSADLPGNLNHQNREIELKDIKDHWREIRAFVKERSKHAEALLNSSRLVAVKDNSLYLGFATEVLRSNMNTDRNKELIHQAILQILQADLKLICILITQDLVGLPPELNLEEDGIVGTALTLGGKIVKQE